MTKCYGHAYESFDKSYYLYAVTLVDCERVLKVTSHEY